VKTKQKPGRPPKSSTKDADDHSKHFYLEYDDGTPVSKEVIASLSVKARMTWEELHLYKMAPSMFCWMTKVAWEFYWYSMAAYPEFKFILLCEGREWKLRQWSIDSYSSWTRVIGLWTVKPKAEDLNNLDLIRMNSSDDADNPPWGSDNDDTQSIISPEIEEENDASIQQVH
jgi:hypothetical protein